MRVTISRADLQNLREAAAASPDAEICGLIFGTSQNGHFAVSAIRPARNAAPDPIRHFEIDPATLIEAHRNARTGGPATIGHYHSHPNGRTAPSETDISDAPPGQTLALIVASNVIQAWVLEDGKAEEALIEEA